jgi:hypothetical protein
VHVALRRNGTIENTIREQCGSVAVARRDPHQYGRRLLFDLQTRNEGQLPALCREAPAPLRGEFDFRYRNRLGVVADNALKGIPGKRLTYRRPHLGDYDKAIGKAPSEMEESAEASKARLISRAH